MTTKGIIVVAACLLTGGAWGQRLTWQGVPLPFPPTDTLASGPLPVRYRFARDIEYTCTFTALHAANLLNREVPAGLSLLQHFRCRGDLSNAGTIRITGTLVHDLGLQYLSDSIFRFRPDENTFDTRFDIRITRRLSGSLFSSLTTPLFNSYIPRSGTKGVLSAAFLTPLVWTFAAGITAAFPFKGSVSLGITSGKFTIVRSGSVYVQQGIEEFYGVPRGKGSRLEFGMSLHLAVDDEFLHLLLWNCDLQVFQNYRRPVDLLWKNRLGFRIGKYVRAGLQTRVRYEPEISPKVEIENQVSLGFTLSL